jgi:hypothetical protein
MKYLLLILILSSCTQRFCYPSKGSKDYAWKIDKVEHTGPGHIAYMHRFERGARIKKEVFYECLPDSVQMGKYVKL